MVFLKEPVAAVSGTTWETVQADMMFRVQREKANPFMALFITKASKPFRIVTVHSPSTTIAEASKESEILIDADLLTRFIAGVVAEDPLLIPEKVKSVLAEIGKDSAETPMGAKSDGPAEATAAAQKELRSEELLKQLEPWALTLMENADSLRYVCYAMKVITSIGADVSTAGMGGEEVVQCCFLSVDAALVGSWLTWLTSNLLDSSPASNVVRKTLAIKFDGGPRSVAQQADEVCQAMRPEDVEPVTQVAMLLKRRISILVGDLVSLFIKNDFAIGGVMISELLLKLAPIDASDGLRRMVAWYECIPADKRGILESNDRLGGLLGTTNSKVRGFVMDQYDKPLSRKIADAGVRQLVLLPVPFSAYPNLALTAALGSNSGKQSCEDTFSTLTEKMPVVAQAMQKALSIAFGTLILLAHCADKKAVPASGAAQGQQKVPWTAQAALEVLPVVLAAGKMGRPGSAGSSSGILGAVGEAMKKAQGAGAKK